MIDRISGSSRQALGDAMPAVPAGGTGDHPEQPQPDHFGEMDRLGECAPAPVRNVEYGADEHRGDQRTGERQQTKGSLRLPGDVRKAHGQRDTEGTEVTGQVLIGAVDLAEHQRGAVLNQDQRGNPRQSGSQPATTSERRGTHSIRHDSNEVRYRLGWAKPHLSVHPMQPVLHDNALGATVEVRVEHEPLVTAGLAVDVSRDQLESVVTGNPVVVHTKLVVCRPRSVPGVRS